MRLQNTAAALCAYLGASSALFYACSHAAAKRARANLEKDTEVLLILGAWVEGETPCPALQKRIDCAAAYLQIHPDTLAVASGGLCHKGQKKSEARVIYEGLLAQGIAQERVLLEEESGVTTENYRNCKRILHEHNKEDAAVGILTNRFHILRAGLLAKRCGFRYAYMLAAENPESVLRLYLRERIVFGEVLYWWF